MRGALRARHARNHSPNGQPQLGPYISGAAARAVWDGFLVGRTSWSRPWALYVLNEVGEAQSREHRRAGADFQSNIRNPRSDVTARRSL